MEFAPAIVALLLVSGCSDVESADYPGVYILENAEGGNEQIEILADGKYRLSFEVDGKFVLFKEGYWQIDRAGGEDGMTFIKLKSQGYRFIVPERTRRGEIMICLTDDICYKKASK